MRRDSPFRNSLSSACTKFGPAMIPADLTGPERHLSARAPHGAALITGAFLVSASLAVYSLVVTSGDGARAAAELVGRFAVIVFAASLIARPLARLFPTKFLSAAAVSLRASDRISRCVRIFHRLRDRASGAWRPKPFLGFDAFTRDSAAWFCSRWPSRRCASRSGSHGNASGGPFARLPRPISGLHL